jgi:hypothetical protein
LLPVDFSANDFRMEDHAKTFKHLGEKHFSAFFICDYIHKKIDPVKYDRSALQRKAETSAKKLKVDLKFIPCPGSLPSLWYQSRFADLLILSPLTGDSAASVRALYDEKFFDDFGCPVFLSGNAPADDEDIVFLFDNDPSGLTALKSYLGLFGGVSANKKLTIINISSVEGPGIYFEESLIHYLQRIFTNVGILPMNKADIERNLIEFAAKATRPLLIMGKSARSLLDHASTHGSLTMNNISIYYSIH